MPENTTLDATTGAPLGEISHAPPALEVFLDKHQMKLIVLAVILIICAVVYVVMSGIRQSHEETAGAMLTGADSLSDLQSVVAKHGDTAAAFSAKILLAEKQWQGGQQDDAIATLKKFVESEREHPARPSAEASLASKLLSQGRADDATKYFMDLTKDPDSRFLAPYAWISIGDIELTKGNLEAAVDAYEKVEEEFPGSTFSQDAVTRRLLAKAKEPVAVAKQIQAPSNDQPEEAAAAPGIPAAAEPANFFPEVIKEEETGEDAAPFPSDPEAPAAAE